MKDDEETNELEKGSESELVQSLLAEEANGLGSLEEAISNCTDPQLKEILTAIQEDEQKHNAALEQWMQENGGGEEEMALDVDEPGEDGSPTPDEETEKEDPKGDLIEDIKEILAEHEAEKEDEEEPGKEEADDDSKPDFLKEEEAEDEDDPVEKVMKSVPIIVTKSGKDQQIVYGVVSEPDSIDLQGDRLSKSEIRKACHKFMLTSQKIGKEHDGPAKADIIESYIAPTNFKCGGQVVKSGSWVMAVKIHDPDLWQAVKKGDITGFSIAGTGNRTEF